MYESTDVTPCAPLLVFVRHIHLGDIKEELLLCKELQTISANVLEKYKPLLILHSYSGNMFVGIVLIELLQ